MTKLEDLLSKLPSSEKSHLLSYEGKAVSRDKDNLHLAVPSGVVSIPLTDIEAVKSLSGQSDDIVSVTVKGLDGIKQLRQAGPFHHVGWGGGIFNGGVFGNAANTFSNGRYMDSVTASGGRADSTDDAHWVESADDVLA